MIDQPPSHIAEQPPGAQTPFLVAQSVPQQGFIPTRPKPVPGPRPQPGPTKPPAPTPTVKGLGYDPVFLGVSLPVPQAGPSITDLVSVNGSTTIPYTHFSLAMSRERKLARWVAWNIDGTTLWGGETIPRDRETFKLDPRVPASAQTGNDVYANNRLDRGHLARRADLLWGTKAEAERANSDSFYFTNITPQMDNFNQSGLNGLWGRLENFVLEQVPGVTGKRISLQGGPILQAGDKPYRGVQVPTQFYKVMAYQVNGVTKVRTFVLAQDLTGLGLRADEWSVYEVSPTWLEDHTGLRFADLIHHSTPASVRQETAPRQITTPTDVNWSE